ncbi:DUF4843 domain-containing protein [Meridianimaribacter flavus]|uniref:DUF4843 domain-containing protein n=1 Tax=Gaetbulibacter sp. NE TaxID=2982307 RepID=UPI0021D08A09|nr:DUF4843 domain-containing protein [Gaetbulibacter sp. NE]
MKKIFYLSVILLSMVLVSCDEDDNVHQYTGNSIVYFDGATTSSLLVPTAGATKEVVLVATNLSDAARSFSVSVDAESTAQEGVDFNLVTNSITIAAGEYSGSLVIEGLYDGADPDGTRLILNLDSENAEVAGFSNSYSLDIFKQCESDLSGSYSVTTTYGYHDFLPDYNPSTIDADITEVDAGVYSVSDFSGGLYSEGPYAGAYGTDAADNTLVFTDFCGNISWEGQTDPWGDIIPLDGGTNSVDSGTGVITLSWYCTGYGENGVSVYTPQ